MKSRTPFWRSGYFFTILKLLRAPDRSGNFLRLISAQNLVHLVLYAQLYLLQAMLLSLFLTGQVTLRLQRLQFFMKLAMLGRERAVLLARRHQVRLQFVLIGLHQRLSFGREMPRRVWLVGKIGLGG